MKRLAAFVLLSQLVVCSSVRAQQAPPVKPKELDVFGKYVGYWTSDVVNQPGPWDPTGTKYRTINQVEKILDGWFLQNIEVNHVVGEPEKVTKAVMLWTYDPRAAKYVVWWFQSTGLWGESRGDWNAARNAFTLASIEPPPNTTGTTTERFTDDDTIAGQITFIDDGGQKLMDMAWTRNRQTEAAGRGTAELWKKIGTPIQPLPDELKKLEPFVGERDAEYVNGPSVASPGGSVSKGQLTGEWVLDGRFFLGTSAVEQHRSMWLIGYDVNKKAYLQVRFTNAGQIDQSWGEWNEATRTFSWKVANERPGVTRTSTNRLIGADAVQTHIVAEDKDGKVLLDLTIRSTRRK